MHCDAAHSGGIGEQKQARYCWNIS